MPVLRALTAVSLASLVICLAESAAAQSYPDRPIRILAGFPSGSAPDILARLIGDRLGESLGQRGVVENRPGAGGNIGIDATAKAAPDGYTLGIASVGHLVINNFLYARLPYDPAKDLVPVGNYAVKIVFDDGHDTGLYTWSYLSLLGREKDKRWAQYLKELDAKGLDRG